MKRNLRKIGLMATVLLAVMLIAGCAKFQDFGVYDKTVPEDQLCTLDIEGGLYIREFNGLTVGPERGWGLKYGNIVGSKGHAIVKIPAGTHTLLANYYLNGYGTVYSVEDINTTHTFKAGRTYRLSPMFFDSKGEEVSYVGSTAKLVITEK